MLNRGLIALASIFAGLSASLGITSSGGYATTPSRKFKPYTDKLGLPHGSSGAKLARKAAMGRVGLTGPGRPVPIAQGGRLLSNRGQLRTQRF